MALDGVVISAVVSEWKKLLLPGGRIYKIYQPEVDEICLVVKNRVENENRTIRLVLSADATLPMLYAGEQNKENPAAAPNFCMLLRKHIGNGRIINIVQPDFERIVEITVEHLDEMGDLCQKKLIIEIMGKHSNIIFVDEQGIIVDAIKHVSHQISSVREVLPGRTYQYPPNQEKKNPLETDVNYFMNHVLLKPVGTAKAIYTSLTGLSPLLANEICFRAGVDGGMPANSLGQGKKEKLYREYLSLMEGIRKEEYEPCIAYEGYEPREFSAVRLTMYGTVIEKEAGKGLNGIRLFPHISQVIEEYYREKSVHFRMKQRSADLRKIVSNAIERTAKKYDLQLHQKKDTEEREKYKVYGELITAYGYQSKPGARELVCENYYTGEEITIPLDPELSAMENGKKYFAKYNKLKRTYEALKTQTESSKEELDYLLSVQNSMELANSETDLSQIKAELVESGYIRGKGGKKKSGRDEKSKPLHFISSDGFHMYVGKNNYQNEEITFRLADGGDLWFHAKKVPGSHVIVKTGGERELPDRTYEEAAKLAAYYSSAKDSPKVDVDYTERKNLKKPPGSKPGFVIYHTNFSMSIEPDIHGIREEK